MNALTILKVIAAEGVEVKLAYKMNYGVDKRSGWCCTIAGTCRSSFEKSPEEAILTALENEMAEGLWIRKLSP